MLQIKISSCKNLNYTVCIGWHNVHQKSKTTEHMVFHPIKSFTAHGEFVRYVICTINFIQLTNTSQPVFESMFLLPEDVT